ncbi:hypothetical protein ACSBR2_012146 [Camellia fascicularis]
MRAELRDNNTPISFPNSNLFPQSSLSGALKGCLGNLDGACIEKLLLHCASALESNDATLAQQVMWVLNNVASTVGDPNQRLTSWFSRALISRAYRVFPTAMNFNGSSTLHRRMMSVIELAGYVDLIPWHRFGFCASNSAIFIAIQGCSKVHVLDFSITHCMQWPTLIDALAKRPEGPPSLRISVPYRRPQVPPFLNVSIEEVGLRLANFAKLIDLPFEFNVIEDLFSSKECSNFDYDSLLSQLNRLTLNLRDDEALVINCQHWLRYLPDDQRGVFMVIHGAMLSLKQLKDSGQRLDYEADIGHKIENIISFEGIQRIERLESGINLSQRMKNKGYSSLPFCEETVGEVNSLLEEHASGWGMKKDDDMLVLTWKGHNSVYASVWVPCGFED